MKIVNSVILAALAATASAGYKKGACPSTSSIAYNAAMINSVNHNILYLDAFAVKMYGYYLKATSLTPWTADAPTIECLNLGEFPYTNEMYTNLFDNPTNVLGFKLFFYDTLSGTQLLYKCVDQSDLYDLLQYAMDQAWDGAYVLPPIV